ncbi:hypothetical protein ACIBAG_44795 [Streptomyces sp. NPDC051243]|uniref:hypothetical protein n=1 Tax=Streptomyces sp. NPDC051243 TaxID=3365646 RepID=UPI0037B24BCA
MRPTRFLAALVSAALAATVLTASGAHARARAVPPEEHICPAPDGTNLNEFLGITERLVGPPACREMFAGERWFRAFPSWGTAPNAASAVYPAGYTPARPAPMDDFVSKFLGVRVVTDIGTARERSYTFGPQTLRRIAFDPNLGLPFAFFAAGPLHPLSVGAHTTTVFMRLSAEHCDGVAPVREENCLPAGEFRFTGDTPLQVFPRNA